MWPIKKELMINDEVFLSPVKSSLILAQQIGMIKHEEPLKSLLTLLVTWIDGPEAAFLVKLEPGNVVALAGDVVAFKGRLEHGQVGLAAGRREGSTDVAPLFLRLSRVLEAHDKHVLSKPAFPLGEGRPNTKRQALLAEEGVSSIAGPE